MARLVERATKRAQFSGAETDIVAMAAVRATREGEVSEGKEILPVILGHPLAGETMDGNAYDGKTQTAIFPGDLPGNPDAVFKESHKSGDLRFLRFTPPKLEKTAEGVTLSLPHIRLDKALEFLLGDQLQ